MNRAAFARPAAVALAGLAVLAGCGGSGKDEKPKPPSDEALVGRIADDFAASDASICEAVTKRFLERFFDGKRRRCAQSAREEEDSGARATVVEVGDEKALATVADKRGDVDLRFVKKGRFWLIDSVESSADEIESDDEAAARGAAEAFVAAIRKGDEAALCGLLGEDFARSILGTKAEGVAQCNTVFKGASMKRLQARLGKSKVREVKAEKRSATVKLSRGVKVRMKRADGDFRITALSGG